MPRKNRGAGAGAKAEEAEKKAEAVKKAIVTAKRAGGATLYISPLVEQYIKTVLSPFVEDAGGATVPMSPSYPSEKQVATVKGTFSGAAAGYAAITIDPAAMVANNVTCGYASLSTYATDAFPGAVGSGATACAALVSNSALSSASIGATQNQVRIVACGLRVRYIGTEMHRGGRVVGMIEPEHSSVVGYTMSDALAYSAVHSGPASFDWTEVVWTPINNTEVTYVTTTSSALSMGFLISNVGLTGILPLYEYEAYCHYEFVGPDASPTSNFLVDPVGGMLALGALQSAGSQIGTARVKPRVIKAAVEAALLSQTSVDPGPDGWAPGYPERVLRAATEAVDYGLLAINVVRQLRARFAGQPRVALEL